MTKLLRVSLLPLFMLFVGPIHAQKVFLGTVENKVIMGKMADNRNLGFGCKNIFLEILQDKNYDIVSNQADADLVFKAEILFFDVNKTKRNVSVFHSDVEETLVIIKGYLYNKDGKKIKDGTAEESSSEISTSTLITDEGSTEINQHKQNLFLVCQEIIICSHPVYVFLSFEKQLKPFYLFDFLMDHKH